MRTLWSKTAKSAKGKIALALLGVFAVLGTGALSVLAAGGKADFSVTAAPGGQTVTKGEAVTYTVSITRVNGFTGALTLDASNLPTGTTQSWKLADGTSSNVIPSSQNTATLKLQTASGTPTGTFYPLITATSGKLSHTTVVTLSVQSAQQPNFTIAASPSSQSIFQGEDTSYSVSVNRSGGFAGQVNVGIAGLPSGATASWSPSSTVPGSASSATLQVHTDGSVQPDTYNLGITATGVVAGQSVFRFAVVSLVVQKTESLRISGNAGEPLTPGKSVPLNLTVSNPYKHSIKLTNLIVSIESPASNASCGAANYAVAQVPAARYPITVPGGASRTLTQLGVSDADKPHVELLNQPWNQDACKGASITLDYAASATK